MASFLIDSSFVKYKAASNALYSALLFEAGKPSVITNSKMVPSGVIMMTLAPASFWFDALSRRNYHMFLGRSGSTEEVLYVLELSLCTLTSFSSSTDEVNSVTNSAKA
ncbi:unnamed protein product [Prunus armeniaca]